MIIRPFLVNALKTHQDVSLVKTLVGIHRCGKSQILERLKDDLIKNSVRASHIIYIRYTAENFDDGMTNKDRDAGNIENTTDSKRYYLLHDEVQEITGWKKVINSLYEDANTDIYVTDSNSKLMSSEISTYLSGRYIMISVFALSFSEYIEFKESRGRSLKELLTEYTRLCSSTARRAYLCAPQYAGGIRS